MMLPNKNSLLVTICVIVLNALLIHYGSAQSVKFNDGRTLVVQITTSDTPVYSEALKFVLRVPRPQSGEQADKLVYPPGQPNEGQPIVDWSGKPIGDWGVLFWNGKDRTWQAVASDGNGVILFNLENLEQAEGLQMSMQGKQPSIMLVKNVLRFADGLNIVDRYNSDVSYVAKNLIPVDPSKQPNLYKRNGEQCNAVFVPGAGTFQGPAATPQQFSKGAVIVHCGKNPLRLIQPDIFVTTYKRMNGSPVSIQDLRSLSKRFKVSKMRSKWDDSNQTDTVPDYAVAPAA